MSEKLFMGIDLGTSFIKSGVYTKDGIFLAGWKEPVKDERPCAGVFLQRGEFLYCAVCSCIRKTAEILGESAKHVEAIAFTGQMAGSIGVDENWKDVTTWSCSLDSRYLPYADLQRKLYAESMFKICGTNAPVMCSKYAWFKDCFPEEHARIAKYVMLNGYIIGRLSHIPIDEAKIDYSLITWTGMADIQRRSWSKELCNKMDIDPRLLPEIVECTAIGGYLADDTAKELLLPAGIPLVVGAGDKVSGCIGAGIFDDGEMIFEAASYGAVSCKVSDVRLDMERKNYDVIGGIDNQSYYVHKYIQGSGISIDWFVNSFIKEAGMDQKAAFRKAEDLAGSVPVGSEKMMAIGLLGGSAIPFDSEMKGAFIGHTWLHHKGHFYRALLESFSYDLALTLESIHESYPEYCGRTIRLIGGGAKSTIWPQILSDVTGCDFALLDREDIALWGASVLAASAVGDVDDIQALTKAHVGIKSVCKPDAGRHKHYLPYIREYEYLIKQMHDIYHSVNMLK